MIDILLDEHGKEVRRDKPAALRRWIHENLPVKYYDYRVSTSGVLIPIEAYLDTKVISVLAGAEENEEGNLADRDNASSEEGPLTEE